MVESVDSIFAKLEKPVRTRIDDLTGFKGAVSKKMMSLYSVLDELKEMFREFAAE